MSNLVKRLREEADDTHKNWYRVASDEQREQCRALTLEAADRIAALESDLALAHAKYRARVDDHEALIVHSNALEAENARLNMEMVAYRQKLTPQDAQAMRAVMDALYAEKQSRSALETPTTNSASISTKSASTEETTGKPRAAPLKFTDADLATHGVDCPKVEHLDFRGGYLHGPNDDSPYYVDGVLYCGRCHGWMGLSESDGGVSDG